MAETAPRLTPTSSTPIPMPDEPPSRESPNLWPGLERPLRRIGFLFYGIAAIVLAIEIARLLLTDHQIGYGTPAAMVAMLLIGWVLHKSAKALAAGYQPGMGDVALAAFGGFGALTMIIGVFITFTDPAGLFACAFGAVFIGVGFLARKIVRSSDLAGAADASAAHGKRRIVLSSYAISINEKGSSYRHSGETAIDVDTDANDQHVERAKADWAAALIRRRVDWARGEVITEKMRTRGNLKPAAILFSLLAVIFLVFGPLFGNLVWVFPVAVLALIAAILWGVVIHTKLYFRKFGESIFAFDPTSACLGGELRGEVRTGVASAQQSHSPYTVTFRCKRYWEETSRSRDSGSTTVRKSKVLWETSQDADPSSGLGTFQRVPIAFSIPGDMPPTTLESGDTGNFWELELHLPLPGIDYRAEFRLPVLPAGIRVDRAMLTAPTSQASP